MTAQRLTPEQITASWLELVGSTTPVSRDEPLPALTSGEDPFQLLSARRAEEPLFFAQHDYDWAFELSAYSRPAEAALQVRALDAALGLWKCDALGRRAAERLERIVVRSTSAGRLREPTPHTRESGGIAFIVCPTAWTEALGWYTSGLHVYANTEREFGPGRNAEAASRHALSLVAHLLASAVCPDGVPAARAVSAIREQVPAFRSAAPERARSPICDDLSSLAVDMALCHEVGRRLRKDILPEAGAEEAAADTLGLIAFISSWDVRHARLKDVLGNLGRLTLAVASYWHFLPTYCGSLGAVAQATAQGGEANRFDRDEVDRLVKRGADVLEYLDGYLAPLRHEQTWIDRSADERLVDLFFGAMYGYRQVLLETTRRIPVDELDSAARLAAEQRA